jgi:hypothetical protein
MHDYHINRNYPGQQGQSFICCEVASTAPGQTRRCSSLLKDGIECHIAALNWWGFQRALSLDTSDKIPRGDSWWQLMDGPKSDSFEPYWPICSPQIIASDPDFAQTHICRLLPTATPMLYTNNNPVNVSPLSTFEFLFTAPILEGSTDKWLRVGSKYPMMTFFEILEDRSLFVPACR